MKVVTALSGGMDSATVLAKLLWEGFKPHEVTCLGFMYGSKHNKYENAAAQAIADYYHVNFTLLDISKIMMGFRSNLLKSGGAIPEGHYEEDNMKLTVVPFRNGIFMSVMAGLAQSIDADLIALGIHKGDHAIYPDCRLNFLNAMDTAISLGTEWKVSCYAPFIAVDKTEILKWGLAHEVPYHLTRTCYKDQSLSCGACGSCNERLESFKKVGKVDPILYSNLESWEHL